MYFRETLKSAGGTLGRLFGKATEPHFLFPAFAVIVLAVIWWTTLNLIKVERIGAEQTAIAMSRELVETYEAQVVRALREIDQTLKLVKYAYEHEVGRNALKELKGHDFLPPDIVYVISIADPQGNIVACTRPPEKLNIADQDFFKKLMRGDTLGQVCAALAESLAVGSGFDPERKRRAEPAPSLLGKAMARRWPL